MDYLEKIDGSLTLKETESVCEVVQHGGFQLDSITFGTVFIDNANIPINKAEFDLESSMKILNDLTFVEVGNSDPNQLKNDMTNKHGLSFICDSQIYIENSLKRVMVFGKRA